MVSLAATDFLMTATLTVLFGLLTCPTDCRLWQENAKPKMEVNHEEYKRTSHQFSGNGSSPDYFRLLELDGQSLLVGARNLIYNISLPLLQENQKIEWPSSPDTIKICLEKGKSSDECQNYVRVLIKKSHGDLLVCGTNAYSPMCRDYQLNPLEGVYQAGKDVSGVGSCPYDPRHNSTATFADGHLYAATVSDFAAQDALIRRTSLRTSKDNIFLNEPNFVGSFALGDFVYFFFRENAVEFLNCGKATYSRVARVCKNDRGGIDRRLLGNNWSSFLKTRLNCSAPGDQPFQFDELQSISGLMEGNYNGVPSRVVYGVFTTPVNSIAGSAVCVFNVADMDRAFDGRFKEQRTINQAWLPVSNAEVPEPRPGQCVNDSQTLPDQVLKFAKDHTIMNDNVALMYGRPVLIYTSLSVKYTAIAIAPQVKTVDDRYYDVVFVGTDDGRIIKTVNLDIDNKTPEEPVVIEEIEVLRSGKQPVTSLKVVGNQVIAVFTNEIHAMPVERCGLMRSCRECVALRDPHCAWMDGQCQFQDPTSSNVVWPKNGHGPIQNVRLGRDERCPAVETTSYPSQSNYVGTVIKHKQRDESNEVPEYQTSNVELGNVYREETLAVAVVLTLVFSLAVGFAIGYLVSRYRQTSFKESSLSETSDYSYTHSHPHPGVVDARPTDYRSEPIYAPPEFPPTLKTPINVVLNMQRNTLKSFGAADSKPIPPSKKVYL
ncbi:Semaphorin-1A [Hypsibius exemplaris]|uniref:Semaphorin-1A n=1 Tax=Hypsibius exemplaris TaxID=2072580 RepID=A0A1W0WPM8_HYPEX|nr:Semaphorin-1A [Hypsibius exemplaris]